MIKIVLRLIKIIVIVQIKNFAVIMKDKFFIKIIISFLRNKKMLYYKNKIFNRIDNLCRKVNRSKFKIN